MGHLEQELRRALEEAGPSRTQLDTLVDRLEAAQSAPRRRLGRRAAVALALCAALAVTAAAAGPSIRAALEKALGPFRAYSQELEGSVTVNGVEIRLLEAVTDGYSTRVYYTLTDLEGSRFNDHTRVSGRISTENLGAVARAGGEVISYDPDTGALLAMAELYGADFSRPATLSIGAADPSWREFYTVLPVTVPETPIKTTVVDGRTVALPGQNTVADPDNADYVVSTVGFDEEGRFHALVTFDEQFRDLTATAYPYVPEAEGMDRYPGESDWVDWEKVEHGEDTITTGVTPEQVKYLEVSGSYRGPEEPVELNVTLPLELRPVESWTAEPGRAVDGVQVEKISLSPLSLAVFYRDSPESSVGQVILNRKDGAQVPLRMQIGGAVTREDPELRYDFWAVDEPVELEDIASVTIRGETFPAAW